MTNLQALRIASLLIALLAGCASPIPFSQQMSAEEQEQLSTPLVCSSQGECEILWRRVQVWIAQNAGYRLRTTTNAVIETYPASSWSMSWALTAYREPDSKGGDLIWLEASCGPTGICAEPKWKLIVRFNRAMRAAP